MNTDKKPVDATTAVAKEPLEVTEKDVNEANTLIAEEHYVGKDGDRLFTRDEVSIILRKRIERHDRALLAKYHLSSMQELDELVRFGNNVLGESYHYIKRNHVISEKRIKYLDVLMYLNKDKKKTIKIEDFIKELNMNLTKAKLAIDMLLKDGYIYVPKEPLPEGEYAINQDNVFGTIVTYEILLDDPK